MNFSFLRTVYLTFSIIILGFYAFYFYGWEIYSLNLKEPETWISLFTIFILLWIIELINEIIYKKIKKEKIKNVEVKKIYNGSGILELDNNPPDWLIKLFYITVIFSTIYLLAYFFTDFAHTKKEYELAFKKQMKKVIFFEKTRTQVTLETAKFKKEFVEEGKALFQATCASCHNPDGGGNICPNLTDDYWINKIEKNLFKNIFYIIWNGSKNNPTMRAFGVSGEIKGNDIEKISSYVYFINKNSIKPSRKKNPEGEKTLWLD
jgi:cytochrome c oxidase cbb3-type subunit 3